MSNDYTVSEVARRFLYEQEHIDRYTQFLRAKSTIHDHEIEELNRVLKRSHIKLLPIRAYERTLEPYSEEEVTTLLKVVQSVTPEIFQAILGHEQGLDNVPDSRCSGAAADHLDQLPEWIEYVLQRLPYDAEELDEDALLRHVMAEHGRVNKDADDEDRISQEGLWALISTAMEHAKHVQLRRQVDALVYARERCDDLELMARAARPDAEVNLLRQSFLLLMAAFDAAVFDLVRLGLKENFFRLIGVFGKHEKISLEYISDAGSFETLRDQIIDEQLRRRYVKDLLGLLQTHGMVVVEGDRYAQLVELILRRNIHVHGRGRVDDRYLEANSQSGRRPYNLFNFKLGDNACIDGPYLKTANDLCGRYIRQLAEWANLVHS